MNFCVFHGDVKPKAFVGFLLPLDKLEVIALNNGTEAGTARLTDEFFNF